MNIFTSRIELNRRCTLQYFVPTDTGNREYVTIEKYIDFILKGKRIS